jgi:hypothetical protein
LPDGAGGFRQDFSGPALLRIPLVRIKVRLRDSHALWCLFPEASAYRCFLNAVLQPPWGTPHGFGLFPFRSPLLGKSLVCFLFLSLLRCFSSGGWPPCGCYLFKIAGCPIRKSGDIMLVCSSPRLIAAYHVLLRLSDPRHPPFALACFKKFTCPSALTGLGTFLRPGSGLTQLPACWINHYAMVSFPIYFPNMSKNFTTVGNGY